MIPVQVVPADWVKVFKVFRVIKDFKDLRWEEVITYAAKICEIIKISKIRRWFYEIIIAI